MSPVAGPSKSAYGASVFSLELDASGQSVGLCKSVEGGNIKADPIKYQNGFERPTLLRSGRPKYEDVKIQVGMAMSQPFFEWIKKFVDGVAVRKTGAFVAGDFYYNERARREFDQAMICELGFPKLDGTDKNAAYLSVTISAETIVYKPGKKDIKIPEQADMNRQRKWTACNFTMTLDNFPDAMTRVTKIDAFTLKQKPIEYNVGMRRDTMKLPGRIEYPNLVFYIPEADAQPFIQHHETYILNGAVQRPERLTGSIITYDVNHRELCIVSFAGADIFAVTHDKRDSTSEEIANVKVEMSIEKMTFDFKG